jgi:tryptophan synthase alpha chain
LTRLSESFQELKGQEEGALIAYMTVGYQTLKQTPRLIAALIEGGADIVELGVPFSDPIADGPTIQNAVTQSIANGSRPLDALEVAKSVHEKYGTPLVLMSYFNPIFKVGLQRFLKLAKDSGVSGIVVPDLPVEECEDYKKECVAADIDTIFLASPSTHPDRLKRILGQTSGYLYLISLYGVTGVRYSVSESALALIGEYKGLVNGSVPLAVGFGISNPDHVRQIIHAGADGVIVGSALVKVVGDNKRNVSRSVKKLSNLAKALKKATRTGSRKGEKLG